MLHGRYNAPTNTGKTMNKFLDITFACVSGSIGLALIAAGAALIYISFEVIS